MNPTLISLIAQREVLARVKDRVFWVSTAFLVLIVAASVLIPAIFLGDDDRPDATITVVTGSPEELLAEEARELAAAAPDDDPRAATITLAPAPDAAAALDLVRTGGADAALLPAGAGPGRELVGDHDLDAALTAAVVAAAQLDAREEALAAAGIEPAALAEAEQRVVAAAPAQRLLDPPSDDEEAAVGLSFLFALLFFFTTFMFGMSIAQSVVEEKQSRIVELLVAVVPVRSLLAGKVLGALVLALGQVVALLAVGAVGAALAGQGDIVTMLASTGAWFVAFFVLGFGMFSCLWAAAGAVASRQEDLQSTTVPLQALLFVPFFGALYVTTPGAALTALSYIPFTAPLAMPRRLLLGDAALWEPLLAMAFMVLTALVMIAAAARLYERSLMRTRSKLSWREAWTASAR